MRQKTFYGITDQRIIILSGIRTKQSRFIAIREIENLQKFENRDGSGSIILDFEDHLRLPERDALPRPEGIDPAPEKPDQCRRAICHYRKTAPGD